MMMRWVSFVAAVAAVLVSTAGARAGALITAEYLITVEGPDGFTELSDHELPFGDTIDAKPTRLTPFGQAGFEWKGSVEDGRVYKLLHVSKTEAKHVVNQLNDPWYNTQIESEFQVLQNDTLTITTAGTPSTPGGTLLLSFEVGGLMSQSLREIPGRDARFYSVDELDVSTELFVIKFTPNTADILAEDRPFDEELKLAAPLPAVPPEFTPPSTSYPKDVYVASIPFEWDVPFALATGLLSEMSTDIDNIDGADNFKTELRAEFDKTATLQIAVVEDDNGMVVSDAVIQSEEGIDYLSHYVVPEPGVGALLAVGWWPVMRRRRAR